MIKLKLAIIAIVIVIFSVATYYSKQFLDWLAKAGGFGTCSWCSQTHPFYIATNQEIANFFSFCCFAATVTISIVVLLLKFKKENNTN